MISYKVWKVVDILSRPPFQTLVIAYIACPANTVLSLICKLINLIWPYITADI